MSHSLAIWYQCKDADGGLHPAQVEVHFNLWRLRLQRVQPETNFLDIGLKIIEGENIKEITLFLPFAVHIIDLGNLLRSRKTAVAIFNESLFVKQREHGKVQLENEQSKPILCCHCLNVPHDLAVEPTSTKDDVADQNATTIVIKNDVIARFDCSIPNYIRLRILLPESALGAFYTEYSPPDKRLFSSFEKTEVVDFRLNERRNLPEYIEKRMYTEPNACFVVTQINFFLIREMYSEFMMAYQNFHKCRSLEPEIWRPYIEHQLRQGSDIKHSIIYHWKKVAPRESGIEDYNAVVKFRRREVSGWTITLFVLILVVIGMSGSLLANFLHS